MSNRQGYSRRTVLLMSGAVLATAPVQSLAADAAYKIAFANRNASGEQLVKAFFDMLSMTGSPTGTIGTTAEQDKASIALVKPYLDVGFQIQRASGERYTAETYLPSDVDDYEFGDLRETRPSQDVVVVRYSIRATATLPDKALVLSSDRAPRLTVFHWNSSASMWQILSHANFNTPIGSICDKRPLINNGLQSTVSGEDLRLGVSLTEKWFNLLEQGDGSPMLNKHVQGQAAGGLGYTTPSEYPSGFLSKVTINDIVVTRSKNLIVTSLYLKAAQSVWQSQELGTDTKPRLLTFMREADDNWSLIATAVFNPPKELPPELRCVPSGIREEAL